MLAGLGSLVIVLAPIAATVAGAWYAATLEVRRDARGRAGAGGGDDSR